MIKIQLNKNLDIEVYLDFCDYATDGVDFGAIIKKDHSKISKDNCQTYLDEYYERENARLESEVVELQMEIERIEPKFYQALKDVFGLDYSSEEYTGFLSIFDCNPRFPDSKTFQVFYQRDLLGKLEVVLHEIVHFAFFDYCIKILPQITNKLDRNSGPLWELSEIFNVIILNRPEFRSITQREELLFYPELKIKLIQAEQIWEDNNGNLKEFIPHALAFLN